MAANIELHANQSGCSKVKQNLMIYNLTDRVYPSSVLIKSVLKPLK